MTKEQLQQDIDFLIRRSMKSGACTFGGDSERDTGTSSNSIVAIAYGLNNLKNQCMPGDISDMNSCERMWEKLPVHRKNKDAVKALESARNHNYWGKKTA